MDSTPKKKILYVITKSNWGGAQRYVFDLASNLKEEYDVTVASGGEGELKQKLDALGIKTILIRNLERDVILAKEFRVFFDLFKILKSLRPDIVHLNSSKIGGLGGLVTRSFNLYLKLSTFDIRRSTKIIFTAHGWAFNEDRESFHKILAQILYRITILLSHKTICVSRAMASQIAGMSLIQNRITTIHNGIVKTPLFKKSEAQELLFQNSQKLKEFFGFDLEKRKKTIWIGTISELHKNKGLEYSIEAFSSLKKEGLTFVFVVLGEGEERENLEKFSKEKGLENQIIFTGRIENPIKYLKAFSIFTLTSITEGLPYAVLEGGLAELPVVASNIGGIPEIIDQLHSGILIRPRHSKEIKDALIYLHENKMEGKELGKNLKLKVENDFTLEKMIEETKKVYEASY